MKNTTRPKTGLILLLVLLFCLWGPEIIAQITPPPPPGNGEPPGGAPINGLIAIVLAVGAFFGVKRLKATSGSSKQSP